MRLKWANTMWTMCEQPNRQLKENIQQTTNTNCTLLAVRSLACAFVIVHLYVVVLVVMNDDGGKKWKKKDNTQNARVAAMCVYYMAIMHVNARSAHCTSNKWNIFHLNFHNMLALHWIVIVNAAVVHLAAPAIWLLTESLKKTTKPCTCTIYTFGYCHLPILIILLHIYVRENRKKK